MLIYLVCIFFICAPILIAEIALGRAAGLSPVGAYERFRPGSKWWLVGALGVVAGVGIVSFYSVIGGWTLAYIGIAAAGGLRRQSRRAVHGFDLERRAQYRADVHVHRGHGGGERRRRTTRDRARHQGADADPDRTSTAVMRASAHASWRRRRARVLLQTGFQQGRSMRASSARLSGRRFSR